MDLAFFLSSGITERIGRTGGVKSGCLGGFGTKVASVIRAEMMLNADVWRG